MRIKPIHIIFLCLFFIITAFVIIDRIEFPVPKGWPKPVYDFKTNAYSKEKIEFGRSLFYDPILSADHSVSCASCHSPYNVFAHTDHALSHGINNHIGTRNAPALINLAWQNSFLWDGSIQNLNIQSLTPIQHPDEMGISIDSVIKKLSGKNYYKQLCLKAFGDSIITKDRVLKSIAQFELSLISCNSKYDSVAKKQSQFNEKEAKGYQLFKKHCASCHVEPLFSNYTYKNNGLLMDTILKDYGRFAVTGFKNDSFLFKVPTLRNIEYSYPYMHDGRLIKLSEVIRHYANIKQSPLLSKELQKPILLNADQKVDLISFLLTLSDTKFLFDTSHHFPRSLLNNQ